MDQFFAEIERPVYRFVLRLCGDEEIAADIAQETLMRAWERRSDVRNPAARRAWIFRIALNAWNDRLRQKQRMPPVETDRECESRESPPEAELLGQELGERIWRAIGELPERQQQVMHLRVVEHMEIGEIAETLQIKRQLVRSNLAVARKKLREKFQHELAETR